MTNQMTAINHIGIHVGDINKAIEFYKEAMGWWHIAGPFECRNDGTSKWAFTNSIYENEGNTWESFQLAHMTTANGVGIELLQFENAYDPEKHLEFKRRGIFHFAITVRDIDSFLEKFVALGGKLYSDRSDRPVSDKNTITTIFVEDPFGNVFEVHSHSYEYMNKMF